MKTAIRPRRRLLLHVGASKCGSSSLQRYLALRPELPLRQGGTARYWRILPGRTDEPSDLTLMAQRADFDFGHSAISESTVEDFDRRLNRILDRTPPGDAVIISSEGLLRRANLAARLTSLSRDDIAAEVLMFVRPQVDWIQSAWLQWGLWTDRPFARWLEVGLRMSDWSRHARAWAEVPGITRLTVAEPRPDIVSRCLDVLGATPDPAAATVQANSASPRALIWFMWRNRRFRENAHASAHETLVTQLAAPQGPRPASPLSAADIARIVKVNRDGNLELFRLYGTPNPDDPRWFDEAKPPWQGTPRNPRVEDDALIAALIDGLTSLAQRHGELSDENARLRLALEKQWGRLARPLFAFEKLCDWWRRQLHRKSER